MTAMGKPSGIDAAWELLFREHHILERIACDETFTISAKEINKVKEARLMAKFDRSAQLPAIFRRHNLSILPVSRGTYVIGPFETHREVVYSNVRPKAVPCPELETLDPADLYSEASALLFCFNSGVIGDILGSDRVQFTVNGRMASGKFDFHIRDRSDPARAHLITVQNAQVEIDAGYESPDAFCICEAKNMASEELLIRQLYYPYRLWDGKIKKPVLPLFLAYSNDLFHAFRYAFEDRDDYNSLKLLSHTAYTFADEAVTRADVEALWKRTVPRPEPSAIFPQANSFARVVDLLSVLCERDLLRDEVALKYEFDPRQTDYYIAACEYLDLVERYREDHQHGFRLTDEARAIMGMGYRKKYLALMERIFRRPVFHAALGLALRRGDLPGPAAVVELMRGVDLNLSESTLFRRASTVRGWIGWVLAQCGQGEQLSLEET